MHPLVGLQERNGKNVRRRGTREISTTNVMYVRRLCPVSRVGPPRSPGAEGLIACHKLQGRLTSGEG